MAIVVSHATQSAVVDQHVPGEIGPDEWNENHTVTGAVADTVQVIAGAGLTGGGTLSGDVTLNVIAGTGITVNANDVAITATGVSATTYGSATASAQIAVNAQGQITSASDVTIAPAASSITGAGTLTKVDDTNVTLTLGGTPTGALLKATSVTVGWTGTLAAARLNSNVVQAVTNDTNITGSIATQNLTLAWSGTLAVSRGGTGTGSAGGTALDNISGFASTGHVVRTGPGTYAFRTLTAPAAGITVTDGSGVAGNPTLVLADDLAALEALSGTNTIYYRSGASAWTAVTIGSGLAFAGGSLSASGGSSVGNNLLINPEFRIDQRAVGASTARADDAYCLDRWYALTQTASVNISQQTDQEDTTPYNVRITQNQVAAQRCGIAQIIEAKDCKHLRGQAAVLSGRIRCSSSQAIRYAILEWTSTADSVTSDVVNTWTSGTFTAGNFFLAANLTVTATGSTTPAANTWTTITEITGTVSSSANNLIVFIWTEGTAAQNVTLDVGYLKLEKGSAGTENRPRDTAEEFARCLRFYEVISSAASQFAGFGVAHAASTSRAVVSFAFKTMKRIAPTLTLSSVSHWAFYDSTISSFVVWSSSTPTTTEWGAICDVTTTTAGLGGAGQATLLSANNTTSARIFIDAEL